MDIEKVCLPPSDACSWTSQCDLHNFSRQLPIITNGRF